MNLKQMERQITLIYNMVAKELEDQLPAPIPPLVFTKAQTFWGRIRKRWWIEGKEKKEEFKDIRISSNLFHQVFQLRPEEFLPKVTETICHELAHMTHWYHKQTHAQLTLDYLKQVEEVVKGLDLGTPQHIYTESVAHTAEKITLGDITSDPRKARAALRKAGVERPGARWEWVGVVPTEVRDILQNL